ncbi:hypothetical protein DFH07DRAFT_1057966 [Mycena maculata]|uniref:Carbonic anhydrase n=1 Tax=Mycena maculata TaxID=230809 RepID=A0AAD7JSP5_9AGAR|nr:hypothetical protein DFH07DRAFT_1057966 [Mycena maculata]
MLLNAISKTRPCCSVSLKPNTRATLFNAARRKQDLEKAEELAARPSALPPKKRLAIITWCDRPITVRPRAISDTSFSMDARINPFKQLGFSEGDAHIIRNAGGMARDAIRSLVISQRLLGTREIAVYHHTGCGMITFRGSELKRLVKWANPDNSSLAKQIDAIDFLEFNDLEQSVKDDVKFLKDSPLILKETKITGWIHDIETGEATRVI